jgi:ubiquitin carboxyl-terminal hydrolase L3
MTQIGVSEAFNLVDVYGLEPDLLAILPKPVVAFILLFPCTENYENHRKQEDEELKANPQKIPENVFYMRQYLRNACGTVALFHALLNNTEVVELKVGKISLLTQLCMLIDRHSLLRFRMVH